MFWIFFKSQSLHFIFICYCNLSLERFWRELQFCSWKYFNHNLYAKVTIKQNVEHICSPRKLKSLLPWVHDCSMRKKRLKLLLGTS
jgi:hypothetical protein